VRKKYYGWLNRQSYAEEPTKTDEAEPNGGKPPKHLDELPDNGMKFLFFEVLSKQDVDVVPLLSGHPVQVTFSFNTG
jgi:hypothetical protein